LQRGVHFVVAFVERCKPTNRRRPALQLAFRHL
jgi:hypothetical protein